MTKYLDTTHDSAQVKIHDVSAENFKKHEDAVFAQNINTENKIQVLHASIQYDMNNNRGYESVTNPSKQNEFQNRSHTPTGDDLFKSRVGMPQSDID